MLKRLTVIAALAALVACAGQERAGDVLPTPAPAASPAPAAQAAAPVVAPNVSVPTPATQAQQPAAAANDDDIVVPGGPEVQVPAPRGDPRSLGERMEDVRAWDQCVTTAQAAFESDPMSPQLDTPEDYCARSLGMASRDAVPESRRRR